MGAASHSVAEGAIIKRGKAGKVKEKTLLEPLPLASDDQGNSSFARALGSVDFLTRERGVQALTRLLQRKTGITEADMTKLWKGLYFCFWHSDKAPVQAELADRLSCIFGQVSDPVAWLYFTVFFSTMRREWFAIDHLRLDKFLMLVRKFVKQLFLYLQSKDWDTALVARYMDFLQTSVLLPPASDHHRAAGLAYHVADVYIPELRDALGPDRLSLPAGSARQLLQPFVAALQLGGEDALVSRVRGSVFEPLIDELRGGDDDGDGTADCSGSVVHGVMDVNAFAAELFELGARADVRARNRAALYGVSQELEKAARKRAKRDAVSTAPSAKKGADTQKVITVNATAPAAATAATGDAKAAASGKRFAVAVAVASSQEAAPVCQENGAGSQPGKRKRGAAPAPAGPEQIGRPHEQGRASDQRQAALQQGALAARSQPAQAAVKKASLGAQMLPEDTEPVLHTRSEGKAARSALKQSRQANHPQPPAGTSQEQTLHSATALDAPAAAIAPSPAQAQTRSVTRGRDVQQPPVGGGGTGKAQDSHTHVHFKDSTAQGPQAAPAAAAPTTGKRQATGAHGSGADPTPKGSAKKSVRINLKKNLYFDFGGPVPDAMVRTPPSARSKGGILKKTFTPIPISGRAKKHRLAGSQSAPPQGTAYRQQGQGSQRGQQKQQQKSPAFIPARPGGRGLVTPNSVPRARAADLFA